MSRSHLIKAAALCVLAALPLSADAQRLGVTTKAGTDGLGGALTVRLIPALNLRAQAGFFAYGTQGVEPMSYETESVDMQWTADGRMFTVSALADWHPFGKAFRISGGAYYNGAEGKGTIESLEDIMVGEGATSYTLRKEEIGQMEVAIKYPSVAPYLGLGFGNAVRGRFGFSFDLGAVYMGEPQVALNATGAIAPSADAANAASIQESIKDAKFLPVLSIGVSTRLF